MEREELTMVEFAFIALTVMAISSAILALEAKEVVYGAISLAIMLMAMAGFFILLDAPFVAMFQIIVYVGAVAVLILFTVMLVRRDKWLKPPVSGLTVVGIITGLILASTFGLLLINSTLGSVVVSSGSVSFMLIGVELISEYWVALEVLALLLAVSLIGALTLAKIEEEDK
ncbi:MAG TPA: NADH-quinone oxidoreductase subunit J [Candidatus Poseidoniia archaeon]|nr:NADH-quinone oxidoreductase subunit J [Candidatus Poseidoniia archaeon]